MGRLKCGHEDTRTGTVCRRPEDHSRFHKGWQREPSIVVLRSGTMRVWRVWDDRCTRYATRTRAEARRG